ncbi:MAG: DMT family transporter [Candidatus Eisenbacteria bacterium]
MAEIPFVGEAFALAAPVCWAVAVVLFRKSGYSVGAVALNLFKNVVALALFAATLFFVGGPSPSSIGARDYALLLASGVIGIGISDTLFFMTLNRVGASLEAIITTSYSPFIILLSFLFLGERMGAVQIVGVLLILSAVLSVGWMRGPKGEIPGRTLAAGIGFGLLATSTQAVAIVMIKPVLGGYPLIWASTWRLVGGVVASFLLLPLLSDRKAALASLRNRRVWPVMIPATLMGTYVSLLFWLAGMKYTQASIAAALNQTSTLWTFVFAALILREAVTRKRIAGLFLGVVGVAMVTMG